ncbi:MAG: AraC family transcriptional regulator [Sulfitobacter sp.]
MMLTDLQVQPLSQFANNQEWRLTLAHDHSEHLLIWVTRGQGRLLLDGQRRGLGPHNAIFVPAGHIYALELGRQGGGLVVQVPQGSDIQLPQMPSQLRIRSAQIQADLTLLCETAAREAQSSTPLHHEALAAYVALISVWLRRQLATDEHIPERRNAAQRLASRFCRLVSADFATGAPMADYAAALLVTPTHLTRACKSATGKTAADILTERVLYEARHLLSTTKVPAQDIARHLGFGSAAYFTRFMQQHTGETPSGLRRL